MLSTGRIALEEAGESPAVRADRPLYGAALIALAAFFFALMAVLARSVSGQISPAQLVLARQLVTLGAALTIFLVRRRGPVVPRPGLWIQRGVLGGLAVFGLFIAIDELGAGTATLLNYVSPVYAALFASRFMGERMGRRAVAGLLLATGGSLLVGVSELGAAPTLSVGFGLLAGVLSAVLSGGAMATIRALRLQSDSASVLLSFSLFGGLVVLPFVFIDPQPLTSAIALPVLGVAVTSLLAQLILTHALGYIRASSGSAVMQLTPVFTWALALSVLGERFLPFTALGALLCVTGVLLGVGGQR